MKEQIPKWRLQKVEVFRDGILDYIFSGYDLQKDGVTICKFGIDSLNELKEFFAKLELTNPPQGHNIKI